MAYNVFTFCFITNKCFCDQAVRKNWTKKFRFVVTSAKWMLCNDNFKGPQYLSFFCCFIFRKRENEVCLELLLGRFSVYPTTNAVFWIVVWKTLLMFQTFSMCVQGFSSLTCNWKWFWADFALHWVNFSIFLKPKFILIIS